MTPHLAETPVLETKRLTLRAPEIGDCPVLERCVCSSCAKHILPEPGTPRTAWRAQMTGIWPLREFGPSIFCEKASGATLALAGPWYPLGWPEHEIAWSVWASDAEDKGFALEAAQAARPHAFERLGWTAAVRYTGPENTCSMALAQRMGRSVDDTVPISDEDEPSVPAYRHPKVAA